MTEGLAALEVTQASSGRFRAVEPFFLSRRRRPHTPFWPGERRGHPALPLLLAPYHRILFGQKVDERLGVVPPTAWECMGSKPTLQLPQNLFELSRPRFLARAPFLTLGGCASSCACRLVAAPPAASSRSHVRLSAARQGQLPSDVWLPTTLGVPAISGRAAAGLSRR